MSKNNRKELSNSTYGKQESLQAIIFADDFVHNLKPVEKIYPSILLPVVTAPIFDYMLEMLVRSKVQQVFVYCSNHVEKLKGFIESLNSHQYNIVLTPIISDGCRSLGDALRDIDTKGCIRGDFILVRGTAFANIDLQIYMDLHRVRKEKDKNTTMTMIFRDFGSVKDSTLKNDISFVVSNANSRKLLHYRKVGDEKKNEFELEWFLEHDRVSINTALFDTHIYLCSQSVLPLFADNFDFQTIEDFIHGVLVNEEFLDARIYWEPLLYPSYALPINSWKTYQILCRDILQRQSYPLVPDTLPQSLQNYIYMSQSTYKHCTSTLSKGCTIHGESIIGENSILGENSFIQRSVVGPNCIIGINVQIKNSYIISNVIIEDNATINNSIIFSNCTLRKGVKLNTCILLPNVNCTENYSHSFIDFDNLLSKKIRNLDESCSAFSTIFTNNDLEVNDNNDDASSTSSFSSGWSSPSLHESPPSPIFQDDNEIFLSEVIDSLLRGFQDKLECENLILEINSSRYAYNISIRQVSYNVIRAILTLPIQHSLSKSETSNSQSADYYKILKTMLILFKPIILNYIKTENAEEDCLRAIQDVACTNQDILLPCIQSLLHFFYENDILSESKIIEWYNQDHSNNVDVQYFDIENDNLKQEIKRNEMNTLRTAILPFIKWLEEAEEDSSSD